MSSNGNTRMSSDEIVNFNPTQDYAMLKREHLNEGTLFKDPDFCIYRSSLRKLLGVESGEIQWRRPKNIVNNPKFFVDGTERFDVNQGQLGDCWLLSAIANLTFNKKYFDRVVPSDQSFDKKYYAGIFHFRFWHHNKWVDVVIDDYLPTRERRLVFNCSTANNEFWSALLEKAFAKLLGSYKALKGGHIITAMEAFTGGRSEYYIIKDQDCPSDLFEILQKRHQIGSLIGCGIAKTKIDTWKSLLRSKGLIDGHAYSITSVKQLYQHINSRTEQTSWNLLKLIRIRNPWGDKVEWNGAWSDNSNEWASVTSEDRKRIGLTAAPNGEFWISFEDFVGYFDDVEITNLPLEDQVSTRQPEEKSFEENPQLWLQNNVFVSNIKNVEKSSSCEKEKPGKSKVEKRTKLSISIKCKSCHDLSKHVLRFDGDENLDLLADCDLTILGSKLNKISIKQEDRSDDTSCTIQLTQQHSCIL